MEPYRWSPDVEKRVIALLRVGCKAVVICEQIGCSARTARRLIDRWKNGQALFQATPENLRRVKAPDFTVERATPSRASGCRRPGTNWLSDFNTLSDVERDAYREAVCTRADMGWRNERIADVLKMRKSIVRLILDERESGAVEEIPDMAYWVTPDRWPRITASHDDWPEDQPFEDCPKAIRADRAGEKIVGMSHVYRYTRGTMDRQSYCSNASSWLAI